MRQEKGPRRWIASVNNKGWKPVELSNRQIKDPSLYGLLTPPQRVEVMELAARKGLTPQEALKALRSWPAGTEKHFVTTVAANIIGKTAAAVETRRRNRVNSNPQQ